MLFIHDEAIRVVENRDYNKCKWYSATELAEAVMSYA